MKIKRVLKVAKNNLTGGKSTSESIEYQRFDLNKSFKFWKWYSKCGYNLTDWLSILSQLPVFRIELASILSEHKRG